MDIPEDLELSVSASTKPKISPSTDEPKSRHSPKVESPPPPKQQQHSQITTPLSNFIQEQQVGYIRKRSSSLPRILPPIFDQESDDDGEDEIVISLEVIYTYNLFQLG